MAGAPPAIAHTLLWQRCQWQRRPTRDGGAVHIQHHGHQHVIAIGGDQVHHALLAKAAEHTLVGRVVDRVVLCNSWQKS